MDLKSKATYALAFTKWKIDHELRLGSSQNKLREIQGEVHKEKYRLAELTYSLYEVGKISDETLLKICNSIESLYKIAKQQENEIEMIKAEIPPQEEANSSPITGNGVICPKCGGGIPKKYCPKCGVEGVLISSTNASK